MQQQLRSEIAAINPALIIFDKDGTLLDFKAMWGVWATELAQRLEAATHRPVAGRLFERLGYQPDTGQVAPNGPLALTPMARLRLLTLETLDEIGISPEAAETALALAWHIPDPVKLARPLADLGALFSALQALGLKIAIATTDDRGPTMATLIRFNLSAFVAALICADDGSPVKPAPDMVLNLCQALHIPPARAIVVGDTAADLQMGCAAP